MLRVRRLVPLALVTVVALAASACGGAASAPPAARVLGDEISDARVATTANVFKALFGLQQAPCGQKSGAGDTDDAACNRYALGALIQFQLTQGYADDHGLTVSDDDLTTSIDGFESQVGKDTVAAQLQANGVTHDDFRELVRSSLLENAVAKDLAVQGVDETELRNRYERNIVRYTDVTVDHILVKTKAEAEDVYRQVTAPGATRQDFLALAKDVSIDPAAKQNSGSYPSTPASQYAEPFARAAVALEPGEISRPVHTQFGWHVIRLVAKDVKPLEEVRDQLVSQQDQSAAFSAWIQQQVTAGQIDVNPSFGRFDPDTLQVVRITSTDPSATPSSAPSATAPASP
jgi:foldase protein PrsA